MCLIFEGINYYVKAHGKLLRLGKILGLNLNFSPALFCWFFSGVFCAILFWLPNVLYFYFSKVLLTPPTELQIYRGSVVVWILPFSFDTTLLLSDTWCRCFRSIIFIFGERGIIFLVFFWRYGCFWNPFTAKFALKPKDKNKKLVTETNFQNIVEEIGRIKFQNVESRIAPHENKCRSHDFISCQILRIFQPLLINVLF